MLGDEMQHKYVIIGAGNGGQSLAGDMAIRGTTVSAIYDKNPIPIRQIKERGGIKMSGPVVEGFGKIEHPTESLEDAMSCGDVFLITIVANFHRDLAKEMAPYIKKGDTILLIPGNAGSSLMFRKALADSGVKDMPLIGETISMPYATRLLGEAHAGIKARKLHLPMAALPASRNNELLDIISPAIPEVVLWDDTLSIGMSNPNPDDHVPYYLLNIGKVEAPTPADYDFHAWGTPTTDRISALYDDERMSIMKALGLNPISKGQFKEICYHGKHFTPIKQEGVMPKNAVQVPDRFVDEDVPLNMVLMEDLGKKLGIKTPVTSLLIDLADLERQKDFRSIGIKASDVGIEPVTAETVKTLIG